MPTLSPRRLRDTLTALTLFLASAAFTLWQNAHVAVLWDLAYLLDSAWRFSLGQLPYRDLPFAHPPLTFLIQAVLIRLFGRVYWHTIAYAALANGAATLLTWRITLRLLPHRWLLATLLCATLIPLGIYSIYPHPIYDSDCLLAVLAALYLLIRTDPATPATPLGAPFIARPLRDGWGNTANTPTDLPVAFIAGAACVLPLFFKQNIGLPFLLIAVLCIVAVLIARYRQRQPIAPQLAILAGAALALSAALLLLHLTVGVANYRYWTITFAAQRRLPGLSTILGVYHQPSLFWTVPTSLAAVFLLHLRTPKHSALTPDIAVGTPDLSATAPDSSAGKLRYPEASASGLISFPKEEVRHPMRQHRVPNAALSTAALILLLIPFAYAALTFFLADDPSDRADALLSLWPHLLLLAAIFALWQLRRRPTLLTLLPVLLLAIIHGTFLSQQLWGSTYALWPILILLFALILREPLVQPLATPLTIVITATFLVCGTLYALPLDRLSYNNLGDRTSFGIPTGPFAHATLPALRGMATPGPYLPDFEQLVRTTSTLIPPNDGILLLPGQGPFYFATGRNPHFPVLLLDPATNPYSPIQLRDEARRRNIQWLILNTNLQLMAPPVPNLTDYAHTLLPDFTLVRTLPGYNLYHRTDLTTPLP